MPPSSYMISLIVSFFVSTHYYRVLTLEHILVIYAGVCKLFHGRIYDYFSLFLSLSLFFSYYLVFIHINRFYTYFIIIDSGPQSMLQPLSVTRRIL